MIDPRRRYPFYARLLRLYPKSYRQQYEDEILLTVSDMLGAAPSLWGRWVTWCTIMIDLPVNVVRQQYKFVTSEGLSMMPTFVKHNSIISAALLVPFFVALLANGLDKLMFNHTLYASWLWRTPFIGLWVLYLPLLALLLAAASYLMYMLRGERASIRRRIVDVAHSWPLLATGFVAFGILFVILFHDSGQCWAHSPAYLSSHFSRSWQCSEQNRVDIGQLLRRSE